MDEPEIHVLLLRECADAGSLVCRTCIDECRRVVVAPVSRERAKDLMAEWSDAIAGRGPVRPTAHRRRDRKRQAMAAYPPTQHPVACEASCVDQQFDRDQEVRRAEDQPPPIRA